MTKLLTHTQSLDLSHGLKVCAQRVVVSVPGQVAHKHGRALTARIRRSSLASLGGGCGGNSAALSLGLLGRLEQQGKAKSITALAVLLKRCKMNG
jgi:hypothetical protein